jgi:hypothetical protein
VSLPGFGISVILASYNVLASFPSLSFSWNSKTEIFCGSTSIRTQSFTLARQAFYHFVCNASPQTECFRETLITFLGVKIVVSVSGVGFHGKFKPPLNEDFLI